MWKGLTHFINFILKQHNYTWYSSFFITIGSMCIATLLAFLYQNINPTGTGNIALIYILAVILISYHTDKYRYGMIASIIAVFFMNFFFTYPFMKFNLTISGYPFTFLFMYSISALTCATTFQMKEQAKKIQEDEKLIMEAEKEKLRANLLRAISHDIRTPLTSIIGASSSYLEQENSLNAKDKRELIFQIYEDSNWLLHMVENLLSVTRISNNGTNVLKKTPEAVEEVFFDAISTIKKRYPDFKLQVSMPEDFYLVPMDPILIKQVILNLLENAYFHASNQQTTKCYLDSDDNSVIIHIRDYGDGIPTERLKTIFDAIPSTPSSTADGRKGMGIGLSICKTIINAHNGEIHAINHKQGVEFYFTLPKEEHHFNDETTDYRR